MGGTLRLLHSAVSNSANVLGRDPNQLHAGRGLGREHLCQYQRRHYAGQIGNADHGEINPPCNQGNHDCEGKQTQLRKLIAHRTQIEHFGAC